MRVLFSPLAVSLVVFLPLAWIVGRWLFRERTREGLYAIVGYTSFLSTFGGFGGGLTLGAVSMAGLFAAEAVPTPNRRPRLRSANALDLLLIAFLGVLLVSSLVHGEVSEVLARVPVIIGIVVLTKLRRSMSDAALRDLLGAYMAGGIVVAWVCIGQLVTLDPSLGGLIAGVDQKYFTSLLNRPPGLQGNPNAASFVLVAGMVGVIAHLAWARPAGVRRILSWLACLIIVAAIVITGSRSGLLAAFVILLFAACRAAHFGWLRITVVTGLVGLGGLLLRSVLLTSLGNVLQREDLTELGRESLWTQALQIAVESPLFGRPGVNTVYGGFTRAANYHNDLLHVVAHAGVPAALIFASILVYFAVRGFSLARVEGPLGFSDVALFLLAGAVIQAMFHVTLQGGVAFWLIMGLLANIEWTPLRPIDPDLIDQLSPPPVPPRAGTPQLTTATPEWG